MKNFISNLIEIAQLSSKEKNSSIATKKICLSLYKHYNLADLVIYLKSKEGKLKQKIALGVKVNKDITLIKNPLTLELGQGIVGTTAKLKRVHCINDINTCSKYIKDITKCESELAVPLVYKGDLVGVLDSESPKKYFFTSSHIEAFQLVSLLIAPLIYIDSKKSHSTPKERFKEFKKILIEEKFYLNCNISQYTMAETMGISPQYLASLISQFSPHSFSLLIANLRIEKAKELLLNPEYSSCKINQISYESGFSSKSSFNRLFKTITGQTPSEYSKSKS